MAHIAVVEDQSTIADSIAYCLRRSGHEVAAFADGQQALDALLSTPPDVTIVDWMLPGLDGLELARRLRSRHPQTMILMLTARGDEIDRVVGLESGADDYMVKPFSLRELEARVKNLLRRAAPVGRPAAMTVGCFRLDPAAGTFTVDGHPVLLAPREMELLAALMQDAGRIVSREDLLARVWGADFEGEAKTVDVHIRRLREKIEEDAGAPRHVVTVRSRGFRFDP